MKVVDWKGNEIKIGTIAVYGAPETPEDVWEQTVEVIAISEPDVVYNPVTDADDGGGVEVLLTVRFRDDSVETLHARYSAETRRAQWECGEEIDEVFEEGGDLEVIS